MFARRSRLTCHKISCNDLSEPILRHGAAVASAVFADILGIARPMARKPSANRPDPSASAPASKRRTPANGAKQPTLASLRSEIDGLDREAVKRLNEIAGRWVELAGVLNRRAELATQIGNVKSRQGLEVWSPAREQEVIDKVLGSSEGPLPAKTLRLIFRELMSGSRALQRSLRIAFLGPKYSYSHLAAVAKFGTSVEYVPVDSIAAVFEEVNRRHVEYGLVPVENSTDGRIADTLDMFMHHSGMIKLCAEVRLRVRHCLVGKGEWGEVHRVYSKAQALSQCRHWLGKNLPQAKLIQVVSTAYAAELAQGEAISAAVASRPAAEAHGLKILAEDIGDQPHNLTRFAVIAEHAAERTGRDKTSLMIRLSNLPGSLVNSLDVFKKHGVNMTWIESFPTSERPPDLDPTYLFFIDVEGHSEDEPIRRALDSLRKRSERVDVLGSYPRSDTVEE